MEKQIQSTFGNLSLFNQAIDVIHLAFQRPYPVLRKQFKTISGNTFVYLSPESFKPRGTLIIDSRNDYVDLRFIAVLPEFQGRGIGTSLLDFVEDWAMTNSMKSISLTNATSKPEEYGWYGRRGYVAEGSFSMIKELR